jgi:ribonucleoside-diphosphate reductase alpha chain
MAEKGLRNSQLLTIAPTGTLSTMLGVSGGIEPFFATEWERTTKSLHGEDVVYKEHPRTIEELLKTQDTDIIPDYVVTSGSIKPIDRIKMQAVWQRYIDASISSTINLPNDTTPEEVAEIYMQAWKHRLKGVTIFRDGCRRVAILNAPAKDEDGQLDDENIKKELIALNNQLRRGDILDVSDDLLSAKRTLINGCGKMYLHLDFDEMTGEPLETWIECGSGGGCERNLAFISRLMSLALRGGIPIEAIIDQAMSIKPCKAYCDRTKLKHDTSRGTSCPQSIGYAMEELNHKIQDRCFADDDGYDVEIPIDIEEIDDETEISNNLDFQNPTCPECGEELFMEGGCVICKSCGWSRCD